MRGLLIVLCCILFLSLPIHGNAQGSSSVQVSYFSKEDCQSCGDSLQSYLSTLKSTYPFLEIKTFKADDPSTNEALAGLEKKLGRKVTEIPAVVIGDHILSGEKEITEKLETLILQYQIEGGIPSLPLELPPPDKPS